MQLSASPGSFAGQPQSTTAPSFVFAAVNAHRQYMHARSRGSLITDAYSANLCPIFHTRAIRQVNGVGIRLACCSIGSGKNRQHNTSNCHSTRETCQCYSCTAKGVSRQVETVVFGQTRETWNTTENRRVLRVYFSILVFSVSNKLVGKQAGATDWSPGDKTNENIEGDEARAALVSLYVVIRARGGIED